MHKKDENAQPMRELEWLAWYFKQHAREDLAAEILGQVRAVRQRAQQSLGLGEASDVIDFQGPQQELEKAD